MPDPSPDQPESLKIVPRTNIRRKKARKKKQAESATEGSAGAGAARDDFAAVFRLLERLSEKPAGKALLESLIAESRASAAPEAAPPAPPPGKAETATAAERPLWPVRSAAQSEPPPPPPVPAGKEPVAAKLPETAKAPEPRPSENAPADAPSLPPGGAERDFDEAMGAALEEAIEESAEEEEEEAALDADEEDGSSSAQEGGSFLQRQREIIRKRRARRKQQTQPDWRAAGFRALRAALFVLLAVCVFVSSLLVAYTLGLKENRRAAAARSPEGETTPLSPAETSQLESAISAIRQGNPEPALALLQELSKRQPPVRSLNYLRALAALQAGNAAAARKFAEESIALGERVSDCHALLAQAIPAQAESKLEEAIAADPSNPAPFVELAFVKRNGGKIGEALRLLRSAQNRLMPVNAHISTEALEHLIRLEDTPDADLPKAPPGSTRVVRLWSEAYLALRRNEPEKAEETLSTLLLETDMDTFRYILSDAAFRLYLSEPRIQRFFGL